MPIASGVAKQLRYKVESSFGAAPGATSAQLLRRVESSLDLTKETYESAEIRSDYQMSDFRHGVRKVQGNIRGELSPQTYADFFAAITRKDFATGASAASLSITIAGTAPTWTLTRSAGSWITDGFKVGDVVRLTAGGFNAANLNKNLFIVSMTATVLTVRVLNGVALVNEGPIATSTCAVTGKKSIVPASAHTNKSFAIEHWFSDIAQSELFLGCKPTSCDVNLSATGIATVDFGFMGQNVQTSTSQYYTSPTAATNKAVVAAVNGLLMVGSSIVATVTGASIRIEGGHTSEAVVGSNQVPDIFPGRVRVSGQMSAYFEDATLRDLFLNETESRFVVALTSDNTAASDFITFNLPRIKVGGASKSDGERGVVQTLPFTALYNASGTDTDVTTLGVQDSAA